MLPIRFADYLELGHRAGTGQRNEVSRIDKERRRDTSPVD